MGCSWSINQDVPVNQPLYINPTSNHRDVFGLHLPQTTDVVTLPHGARVRFACPGGFLNQFNNQREQVLECVGDFQYRVPGTSNTFNFQDLYCSTFPQDEVETIPNTPCNINLSGGQYSLNRVGYRLQYNDFYFAYEFCFDHNSNDAIYSHFRLSKHIAGRQTNFASSGFVQDNRYYPQNIISTSVDTLYTQQSQLSTFTRILGSERLAQDILEPGTDFYLARGHLAAKAYFIYGTQQASTH